VTTVGKKTLYLAVLGLIVAWLVLGAAVGLAVG